MSGVSSSSVASDVMDHQDTSFPRAAERVSASERKLAECRAADACELRSSGAVPPSEAVDHAASRNSSLVAARSCARVRTFSGSMTTEMEPAGSCSMNGTMASTRTGANDSMPSTAIPPAIFSSMSAAAGSWDFSVAARDITEGVIRISRQGGAWSSVG